MRLFYCVKFDIIRINKGAYMYEDWFYSGVVSTICLPVAIWYLIQAQQESSELRGELKELRNIKYDNEVMRKELSIYRDSE